MEKEYNIIIDREKVSDFIESLPDLLEDEYYFIVLFARNKYNETDVRIPSSIQLFRNVLKKEHILGCIDRVNACLPFYTNKFGDKLPPECFVLYINPNPRNIKKAAGLLAASLTQRMANNEILPNPISEARTFCQKTKSRSNFAHFDFDFYKEDVEQGKDIIISDYLPDFLKGSDNCRFIRTQSGFHLLVDLNKMIPEHWPIDWFRKIQPGSDDHGDILVPIVGTKQRSFSVYEFDLDKVF